MAHLFQQQGSGNNNGYPTRIASKRGQVRRHDSGHGPVHCGRSGHAHGKYLEPSEDHHLRKLADREVTPRLKARAENSFRPDRRRVARNRVNELPQGMDTREAILRGKDAKNAERYQTETPPNSTHRQACN